MAEYDAFGRKTGEDPFAETGWRGEDSSTPTSVEAAPASAAEAQVADVVESEPTAVTVTAGDVPSSIDLSEVVDHAQRAGRRIVSVFVAVVALGSLGAVGALVYAIKEGIESVPDFDLPALPENLIPDLDTLTEGIENVEQQAPPAGLAPRSLIRRAAFAQAISGLRNRRLGRIVNLRVAADRIDVQLLTGDGRLRSVQVTPGPNVRELSLSGPGFGHLDTMPFSAVDTAAPERFTRQAARRHGVSPTRVDYLVLTDRTWVLFFKGGAHFQADASGRLEG